MSEMGTLSEIADAASAKRIASLHPAIRQTAVSAYLDAVDAVGKAAPGHWVRITYGLRTFDEQAKLKAKKPPVTKAGPGQSYHNYGLALDFVIMTPDGRARYTVDDIWRAATGAFKAHGFEWGGDWLSFKDYPHVQLIPQAISNDAHSRNFKPWQILLERFNHGRIENGYVIL